MALISKRNRPDRKMISLDDDVAVKYWCKHFRLTREELEKLVAKMGNSATAIRKELGARPVEIKD